MSAFPWNNTIGHAVCAAIILALGLSGCAEINFLTHAAKAVGGIGSSAPTPSDAPGGNGERYKVGKPYQIKGQWYYPKIDYKYVEEGIASWYGPNFHGNKTANGAIFNMNRVSAAHRTLPMPSMVRVTNLENGRSLRVKVNDRGPFAHRRIIDLSRRAAQLLGFERQGTTLVRVEILPAESQQLAYLMQNGGVPPEDIAPPPASAPSGVVADEELAPPPGSEQAGLESADHQVEARSSPSVEEIARQPLKAPESDERVTVSATPPIPSVFVQVGAFSEHANAVRAKAMLDATVGPTQIQQYNTGSVPLFRVRVGPVTGTEAADRALSRVIAQGFQDAHLVAVE